MLWSLHIFLTFYSPSRKKHNFLKALIFSGINLFGINLTALLIEWDFLTAFHGMMGRKKWCFPQCCHSAYSSIKCFILIFPQYVLWKEKYYLSASCTIRSSGNLSSALLPTEATSMAQYKVIKATQAWKLARVGMCETDYLYPLVSPKDHHQQKQYLGNNCVSISLSALRNSSICPPNQEESQLTQTPQAAFTSQHYEFLFTEIKWW
jgi:hypothetical protein